MKTLSEDLVVMNPEAKDDLLGYYQIEMYGLCQYMKKHYAIAIFGTFERTKNSTVLYSATVYTESNGEIGHCYESEFCDDLNALKCGNVTHTD